MTGIAADPIIPRRQRRRRVFFALVPLIDVMFLLLIFFMLTSQVSPYSLMPVSEVAQAASDGSAASSSSSVGPLAIRVSRGAVRIGGEDVALADLPTAARRFVEQDVTAFVVVPSAAATVQDVVTVLEALQGASAKSVTLVEARQARP